jgi:hypothetical protein
VTALPRQTAWRGGTALPRRRAWRGRHVLPRPRPDFNLGRGVHTGCCKT